LFLSFLFKSDKFSDYFDIAGLTQNTYIVVKYKIHLYSLRNRPEKLAEGSLFCLFWTNILHNVGDIVLTELILQQMFYIMYIQYTYIVGKYKIYLYELQKQAE
jgi:hypothetical protein